MELENGEGEKMKWVTNCYKDDAEWYISDLCRGRPTRILVEEVKP